MVIKDIKNLSIKWQLMVLCVMLVTVPMIVSNNYFELKNKGV